MIDYQSKTWLAGVVADEAEIVARLRSGHNAQDKDGRDWGTWANVMRVRNGDKPQRPEKQKEKNRYGELVGRRRRNQHETAASGGGCRRARCHGMRTSCDSARYTGDICTDDLPGGKWCGYTEAEICDEGGRHARWWPLCDRRQVLRVHAMT